MNTLDILNPIGAKFYELGIELENLPASTQMTKCQCIREDLRQLVQAEIDKLKAELNQAKERWRKYHDLYVKQMYDIDREREANAKLKAIVDIAKPLTEPMSIPDFESLIGRLRKALLSGSGQQDGEDGETK